VGEVAATLEAALAPLRGRINTFVTNCEINGDAVFQRGIKALNALIQESVQ
jgi:hypothetical protein